MNQIDYITRQLARTQKKRFENYVVTRIWHQLNDLELKFTTQQYVKRPNGFALMDMYFPQLKIHIEVDEAHHTKPLQIEQDKIRELDILAFTKKEPLRVDVTKDLNTINAEIDKHIQTIRQAKSNHPNFKPWDFQADYDPTTYIKKGFIDLTDDCAFTTMVDAANCFGHALKPKSIWRGGVKHPIEHDTGIWFPKLYPNGQWSNTISDDENTITEISLNQEHIIPHIQTILDSKVYKRIVFARVKDSLGSIMYRFKGLYELNLELTNQHNGLIWCRKSQRVTTYKSA